MLSLLSNVNTDFVLKNLSKDIDIVPAVGYGNMWEQLLDAGSILNQNNPNIIVIIIDIEDLVNGVVNVQEAKEIIDTWFAQFQAIVSSEKDYFISDVSFRSNEIEDNDSLNHTIIESYWCECLMLCTNTHKNVHILKLRQSIEKIGKSSFYSSKLWYIGKIPYTNEATKIIVNQIKHTLSLLSRINKKILVLDLDNTLWGGILGERGPEGIELSDDHVGAIYKNVQKKLKKMQQLGVMLAICSKNNEKDVVEVWDKNPHMILKQDDFVSKKINWSDKVDNILQMAEELNIGTDSFVFVDDMPNERENVSLRIPGVAVPEFPNKIDDYPDFIDAIFIEYFQHIKSTDEDSSKTQQYIDNSKREKAAQGLSYDEFLSALKLRVERVELDENRMVRIAQLIGKTNQFNITTKRYSRQDLDEMLNNGFRLYAYNINDKFGNYGLVAVVIVDIVNAAIDSFVMSCRVMGKLVENYIINDVETELLKEGITVLQSEYIKTAKNTPVAHFFDGLGYTIVERNDQRTVYSINLLEKPERKFFVEE